MTTSQLDLIKNGSIRQIWEGLPSLDPNYVDASGNNILHLVVNNKNAGQTAFFFFAGRYPHLINQHNNDGDTPIHKMVSIENDEFDWDAFWQLNIKFSKKNELGETCLTKIQHKSYAAKAFEALIKNKTAWTRARKHHKRKRLLTNAIHALLTKDNYIVNDLMPTIDFLLANRASIHCHNNRRLIETALRHHHFTIVCKLLDLGSKVDEKDVVTCCLEDEPPYKTTHLLLHLPAFGTLSQEALLEIAQHAANINSINIFRKLPLKVRNMVNGNFIVDKRTTIADANWIASKRSERIVPLKFLCVDVIYYLTKNDIDANQQKDNNANKPSIIDWSQGLATYPTEIHDLFHRKEFWRWALFVKDEKKQQQIIHLYQTVEKQRGDKYLAFTIQFSASFSFSWMYEGSAQSLWFGDLRRKGPTYSLHQIHNGHTELNLEILNDIMNECGWDPNDAYIFLLILMTPYLYSRITSGTEDPDDILAEWYFYSLISVKKPPQWFETLLFSVYGMNTIGRRKKSFKKLVKFDSGSC